MALETSYPRMNVVSQSETDRDGRYRLEDGSPDIITLLPALFEKSLAIMLKTSPVLDISSAVESLNNVSAVPPF